MKSVVLIEREGLDMKRRHFHLQRQLSFHLRVLAQSIISPLEGRLLPISIFQLPLLLRRISLFDNSNVHPHSMSAGRSIVKYFSSSSTGEKQQLHPHHQVDED